MCAGVLEKILPDPHRPMAHASSNPTTEAMDLNPSSSFHGSLRWAVSGVPEVDRHLPEHRES